MPSRRLANAGGSSTTTSNLRPSLSSARSCSTAFAARTSTLSIALRRAFLRVLASAQMVFALVQISARLVILEQIDLQLQLTFVVRADGGPFADEHRRAA